MEFAKKLSYNPWHTIAEHRPLGNQSRARRRMYETLSKLRHDMKTCLITSQPVTRYSSRSAMTPQSNFMVLAPIESSRAAELRALLDSMNEAPGRVDPNNALVPFAQFDRCISHDSSFLTIRLP